MAQQEKDIFVGKVVNLLSDIDSEKRIKERLCPICYYIKNSYLAGRAFTEWSCEGCDEPQPMYPNTAYPKLCNSCSTKYGLCIRCIADIYLCGRVKLIKK